MQETTLRPQLIEKEIISNLMFPKEEVLMDEHGKTHRQATLEHAMKLGNNHRHKATITFEDSENVKQVETTVWAVTEKWIILKGSMVIPICRVHEVNF
jgi:hypothetical protein